MQKKNGNLKKKQSKPIEEFELSKLKFNDFGRVF